MRYLIWIGILSGCAVSPEAPESSATFSGSMAVHSSRATQGDTFHGAPYHRWTITLGTVDGCGGDDQVSVEINTVSGVTAIPIATVPLRTDLNSVAMLPSAYLTYSAATVSGGSITIESSNGAFVVGSFAAQTSVGELTATFGAPVCN
ncbi:MAG: hypothetical protein H0T42_08370 [Deltaproteobacteria bacterium]|nr:hypothetical protein [Deltaproteobacteria bacterium]